MHHESTRRHLVLPVVIALASWAVAAAPAAAGVFNVITVGSDMDCDAGTIGAALLGALGSGADEIRLSNNQSYTNEYLHLTDWDPSGVGSLTIVGGYDNCSDPSPSGRTTVSGQSGNPVFEIDTSSGVSNVTLRSLEIRDSGETGVLVEGDSTVAIQNSYIRLNGSSGLRVLSGATVTADFNTSIRQNDATLGGGIHCDDADVTIESLVRENTATSSGGGIFATSDCQLRLEPGGWVIENEAQWGGGVYATGGADVTLNGLSSSREVRVRGNVATSQGGGIYANGVGTVVAVDNAKVIDNQAASQGGGLYATNSAFIRTDRIGPTCIDRVRCTELSGNTLTTAGDGSAAYAENGATLRLFQTWIEQNAGSGDLGFVLYATGGSTEMWLENVQIWDNGGVVLLDVRDTASLIVAYTTVADNRDGGGGEPRLMQVGSSATADLYSSILRQTSGTSVTSGGSIGDAECLVLDALTDVPGNTNSAAVDPQFRGAASGNLRPKPQSFAVDMCDIGLYTPSQYDLAHIPHGYDVAENPDALGTMDAGGLEVTDFFYSGFEPGDTSEWSTVAP